MCKTGHTDKERDGSMYGNYIFKPLPLVAGRVFVRVFLDRLAVHIANMINATQSAFTYERRTEEITSNPRIKVSNKTVYAVVIDSHKNVPRRGQTKGVGIAAEVRLKIVVDMFKELHSGMMESEMRISKVASTFGRLHKHLWKRFTILQSD